MFGFTVSGCFLCGYSFPNGFAKGLLIVISIFVGYCAFRWLFVHFRLLFVRSRDELVSFLCEVVRFRGGFVIFIVEVSGIRVRVQLFTILLFGFIVLIVCLFHYFTLF